MDNIFSMYRFAIIPSQENFVEQLIAQLSQNFLNQSINLKFTNNLEESGSLISVCHAKVDDIYHQELSNYINIILPKNNSFYDLKKLSFINNGDYSQLKSVLIDYSPEYKDHQREMLYNKLDRAIPEKESTPSNKIKI